MACKEMFCQLQELWNVLGLAQIQTKRESLTYIHKFKIAQAVYVRLNFNLYSLYA